jgi:hypothetical protein
MEKYIDQEAVVGLLRAAAQTLEAASCAAQAVERECRVATPLSFAIAGLSQGCDALADLIEIDGEPTPHE